MVHVVYIPEQYLIPHPTIDRWSLILIASLTGTCNHLGWGANHLRVVNNQKWPSQSRIITFVMASSINGTQKSAVLGVLRSWKISRHGLTPCGKDHDSRLPPTVISSEAPQVVHVKAMYPPVIGWFFNQHQLMVQPIFHQSPEIRCQAQSQVVNSASTYGSFIGVRFTCGSPGLAQTPWGWSAWDYHEFWEVPAENG